MPWARPSCSFVVLLSGQSHLTIHAFQDEVSGYSEGQFSCLVAICRYTFEGTSGGIKEASVHTFGHISNSEVFASQPEDLGQGW